VVYNQIVTWTAFAILAMFSFVRTARPGKYFLIETEDGGGEGGVEDGMANVGGSSNNGKLNTLNKSAGALRCYCLFVD